MTKVYIVFIKGKLNTAAKAAKYLRTALDINNKLEYYAAKIEEGYVFFDEQERNLWGARIRASRSNDFYNNWRMRNKEIIILNSDLIFVGAV